MIKILGAVFFMAVSATASASLKEVCEQTIAAQGNLAASVKLGDRAYVQKAISIASRLGYDDAWYNRELARMRLNSQDRESMFYLAMGGASSEYQPMHDRYMKTCVTIPTQYLSAFYDLARRGLISRSEVEKAEKGGLSAVEGMRPQQGGGLKARAESRRASMEAQNELMKTR